MNSLWPWSDDLSGNRINADQFEIFGVEAPDAHARPSYRSTRTTLPTHSQDSYARPVYETRDSLDEVANEDIFPKQCPRCHTYREMRTGWTREVIENLRTKGPNVFSVIVEWVSVQPEATDLIPSFWTESLALY